MQSSGERAASRLPRAIVLGVAMLALTSLTAACGASTNASASGQVARRACRQIEAALSDGPEPEADPVGYAEAQVLPLHRIRTSDARLGRAVGRLASAYAAVLATGDAAQAKSAVASASRAINALCPGVAS